MRHPAPFDRIFDLLNPARLTAVVDIGASPLEGDPPYRAMLDIGLCTVTGFEPQETLLRALNARKKDSDNYLPYAIGDGKRATFYVTEASVLTSTFEPDPVVLNHFAKFSDWGRVVHKQEVETKRLDDIQEIQHLDFLKIDIQGGELVAFRNGTQKLKETVAIQTEVSFASLYKGQPTYAEVDLELRSQGFIPHAMPAIQRRMIAPLRADSEYAALNHLIEADIIYVRNFMRPDAMTSEQLKHLAIVSRHVFKSYDLAMNCIFHLCARKEIEPDATQRYASIIDGWAGSP